MHRLSTWDRPQALGLEAPYTECPFPGSWPALEADRPQMQDTEVGEGIVSIEA